MKGSSRSRRGLVWSIFRRAPPRSVLFSSSAWLMAVSSISPAGPLMLVAWDCGGFVASAERFEDGLEIPGTGGVDEGDLDVFDETDQEGGRAQEQDGDHDGPTLHEVIDKAFLDRGDLQGVAHGGIQGQTAAAGAGQFLDIRDVPSPMGITVGSGEPI
jgi:hypothetical protein